MQLNVGLEDLIARSREQYVETAVGLAGDLERLSGLRSTLRGRMQNSPLLDFAGFAPPPGGCVPPDVARVVPGGLSNSQQ